MDDVTEDLLHAPNISLTVQFDTVKIEITCADDYQAQVLFDDLAERMEAGQEISIKPTRQGTPKRSSRERP